jgi:aminopeptidase YwaD
MWAAHCGGEKKGRMRGDVVWLAGVRMRKMAWTVAMLAVSGLLAGVAAAQKPPLLPEKDVAALANELSGETAKRNLEGIARFHRQRGSQGFHFAAELVAERLRAYGLSDVAILQFPVDGKFMYGTQKSRPAWDALYADLEEIEDFKPEPCGPAAQEMLKQAEKDKDRGLAIDCGILRTPQLLASYVPQPVVLAEDSESAEVTAELVDVGAGTKESDYAGKDVKGKIVLVSSQPGAVQDLAVGKFGAAGIVSYAQNQKTAWWGEDENLIRWGHLETFSKNKTFAFMVSLKMARGFRERLAKGEKIQLHALVKAGQHPGNYEVVTATIPGADPKLREEAIAFSCHLDHQRPGANDNASGCVTILEVARTLQKLISDGKVARPARPIFFIFPPEIEGTLALLNGYGEVHYYDPESDAERKNRPNWIKPLRTSGPELAKHLKVVIHMDMVGGGPETKAVFHVTRGPMSLPSFVHDVAWAFAEWVNEESYKFAATGSAEYPMTAPEGGKEPLRAVYSAYTMGSDHDVYQDSSFGIPAIYLNDWPDRYIHTNFDSAANIDPTKLKRAAFIGAASGYFLAGMNSTSLPEIVSVMETDRYLRIHEALSHRSVFLPYDRGGTAQFLVDDVEEKLAKSLERFAPEKAVEDAHAFYGVPVFDSALMASKLVPIVVTGPGLLKFSRKLEPKGPLAVFGYDYFADHAKAAGVATPKLLSYEGLWGNGEEYAYEVLNFADGKRNAQEIRDAVSAEYGPVPLEMVVEYLKALEKIGVVAEVK